MRPQDSRNSGRRSNRGPRRSSSRPQGDSRPVQQAPARLTFWQKLKSFFTGGSKAAGKQNGNSRPKYESGTVSNQRESRESQEPRESRESRGARKPESIEVTTPKLYIGNLSFDAGESDLFDLFNGVGAVRNAEIVTNKFNDKSKGFGFVTMSTVEEAKRAVLELHDKDFLGRKLVVSGAKTSERETDYRG